MTTEPLGKRASISCRAVVFPQPPSPCRQIRCSPFTSRSTTIRDASRGIRRSTRLIVGGQGNSARSSEKPIQSNTDWRVMNSPFASGIMACRTDRIRSLSAARASSSRPVSDGRENALLKSETAILVHIRIGRGLSRTSRSPHPASRLLRRGQRERVEVATFSLAFGLIRSGQTVR